MSAEGNETKVWPRDIEREGDTSARSSCSGLPGIHKLSSTLKDWLNIQVYVLLLIDGQHAFNNTIVIIIYNYYTDCSSQKVEIFQNRIRAQRCGHDSLLA